MTPVLRIRPMLVAEKRPSGSFQTDQPVDGHLLAAKTSFQSHKPINGKTGKRYSSVSLLQGYELRQLTYDMILALKRQIGEKRESGLSRDECVSLQCLVKSWDIILNRLRILRGKGLPAPERRQPRRYVPPEPLGSGSSWRG